METVTSYNSEGSLARPHLAAEGKHRCKWLFRKPFDTENSQNHHID